MGYSLNMSQVDAYSRFLTSASGKEAPKTLEALEKFAYTKDDLTKAGAMVMIGGDADNKIPGTGALGRDIVDLTFSLGDRLHQIGNKDGLLQPSELLQLLDKEDNLTQKTIDAIPKDVEKPQVKPTLKK
jgi:hypothetical protein